MPECHIFLLLAQLWVIYVYYIFINYTHINAITNHCKGTVIILVCFTQYIHDGWIFDYQLKFSFIILNFLRFRTRLQPHNMRLRWGWATSLAAPGKVRWGQLRRPRPEMMRLSEVAKIYSSFRWGEVFEVRCPPHLTRRNYKLHFLKQKVVCFPHILQNHETNLLP